MVALFAFCAPSRKMKKIASHRLQDLIGLIHSLYPPQLAETWDNVGLQVGDPAAPLDTVLVSLDPSAAALDAAARVEAQALVCHHPLIFRPLKSLTPADDTGRMLFQAIRQGTAVVCAHTNLDRARDGLNDWLARLLDVAEAAPLAAAEGGELLKLAVFVPLGYEAQVAAALFEAGAGHIGNYDSCSFGVSGTGTFRPGAGTSPFLGRPGEMERAREIRLETVVPRERLSRVVQKLLKAHPYEEPAYDLIPLANARADVGLGRIGRLGEAVPLETFAEKVKQRLGCPFLRLVGDPQRRVAKVAVCGGSGASLLQEAVRRGADVLVTGDVKYHEARTAEALGVALIDAGHFATEYPAVRGLAEVLRQEGQKKKLEIRFLEMEGEQDPFRVV